jgi:hypothetical protein
VFVSVCYLMLFGGFFSWVSSACVAGKASPRAVAHTDFELYGPAVYKPPGGIVVEPAS